MKGDLAENDLYGMVVNRKVKVILNNIFHSSFFHFQILNLNDNDIDNEEVYHLAEVLSTCGQTLTNVV